MGVECLRDCNADCCREIGLMRFDFTDQEVKRIQGAGGVLINTNEGYEMANLCPFLEKNNSCQVHESELQPSCCQDNMPGEDLCNTVRRIRAASRYWEVE